MKHSLIGVISLFLLLNGFVSNANSAAVNKKTDFSVKLVPSLNLYTSDQWYNIPPGRPPQLSVAKNVVVNEFFEVSIYFVNIAIKNGKSSVRYSITIKKPDGSILHNIPPMTFPSANNNITLHPKTVFRASKQLRICFDPGDPEGTYTFNVKATDTLTGKTSTSTEQITLLSWDKMQKKLKGEKLKFGKVLSQYYKNPQPEMLPILFKQFLRFDKFQRKNKKMKHYSPTSILAFFYFVLKDNKFLLDHFVNEYKNYDKFGKMYSVMIFSHLGKEGAQAIEKLDADGIKYGHTIIGKTSLFEFEKSTTPGRNDILWSQFFATGSVAPIKKLAKATLLVYDGMNIETFKALKKKTKGDEQKLYHYLTGTSAMWSLQANIKQHNLVRYYCETILSRTKNKKVKVNLITLFKALSHKITKSK